MGYFAFRARNFLITHDGVFEKNFDEKCTQPDKMNSEGEGDAVNGTDQSTSSQTGVMLACAISIFCITLSSAIVNASVYSVMASFFGIGREIATLMTAGLFLIIATVALKRPAFFDEKRISIAVILVMLANIVLLIAALHIQNPALLMLGLFGRSLGTVWALTVFSVALTTISSPRKLILTVGAGMVISDAILWILPAKMSIVSACVVLMLCIIVPIVVTKQFAAPQFEAIRKSTTANSLGLSEFSSIAKLRSLIVCMLMMGIASGYALAFNEVSDAPVATYIETLVIAVVVLAILVSDSRDAKQSQGGEDKLFSFASLMIVAGYLLVPYTSSIEASVTNSLLRAGNDCFTLLIWLVLASVGRRNIFLLLPVLGAVRCASAVGTDIGVTAGRMTNGLIQQDPLLAGEITTIVAFIFIAFLWLGFRNFSFSRAIAGMKKVAKPELAQLDDHIEQRCQDLGKHHGLTERETEILCLLAKGRDGRFIAEQYVLSYNTVKTHIKHIYTKLDVHSRQELIDLTELS